MSGFTTHVLDAIRGGGAAGIDVVLRVRHRLDTSFSEIARARTDANGRAALLAAEDILPGTYELVFDTLPFHREAGFEPFFDEVVLEVAITEPGGSWHLPIVLSPAAYSAYRGGVPPVAASALPPELAR